MKKLLPILLLGIGATAVLPACKDDFLGPQTDALTDATVFGDSTRTFQFLTRIYGDIGFTFNKTRWSTHGNTEIATDDAEYFYSGPTQLAVVLYSGTYTAVNPPSSDFWGQPWENIRRCNLFIGKLPSTPLSGRKQQRAAAEARFLRAWYYHQLLTCHGGVPLVGDRVFEVDDSFQALARSSYADCVAYLVSELDAVAQILPNADGSANTPGLTYDASDYGRVTRGAALALKSRVLLYAASPLFNGGATTSDASLAALVSYPTYNAGYWQAAADAAKAVLDLNAYALVTTDPGGSTRPGIGFYATFLQRVNSEYIYFVNRPPNKDFEFYYNPASRGGQNFSKPTQNLAAAFPMRNGKAITDPTSGYNPQNPYVNRDPRFRYTIVFNGSSLYRQSLQGLGPVWTYDGTVTGRNPDQNDAFTDGGQNTGYFCRKMQDSTTANTGGTNVQRGWPLIRLAEIYLNYAEALNEVGRTADAVQQIIVLRQRAGILPGNDNRYGIAPGISQTDARTLIRNERRIELAFEDQRWNDIRRWKIAQDLANADGGYNLRMKITQASPTAAPTNYQVVRSVRQRAFPFRPEMYLMPIPNSEIRKAPLLRQNPGW